MLHFGEYGDQFLDVVLLVTLQRFFKFITRYGRWIWLAVTFQDTEQSEEDCPEVEEAKDAGDMELLFEDENEDLTIQDTCIQKFQLSLCLFTYLCRPRPYAITTVQSLHTKF